MTSYRDFSSFGGLLALQAAASGLAIPKLALLEPPIEVDEDRSAQRARPGRRWRPSRTPSCMNTLISEAASSQLLASVAVRTLVLDGEGSSDDLTGMAATVARGMPNASHRSLAGEWHGVADDVLARVLIEFFTR